MHAHVHALLREALSLAYALLREALSLAYLQMIFRKKVGMNRHLKTYLKSKNSELSSSHSTLGIQIKIGIKKSGRNVLR